MAPTRCYRRCVQRATAVVVAMMLFACTDLRDFRTTWEGARVGDAPEVRVGAEASSTARLAIADIDLHGLRAELTVPGLVTAATLESLPGAEADALAGMTFTGSPLRVYLGFVAAVDGGGDALAIVALYDDRRIELRVLRGGTAPIYAIFSLAEAS